MTVQYSGVAAALRRQWGEVGWEELTDGVIVAGQPDGAPSWFPCNDRPNDKASYRLTISAESAYPVVANGRLVDKRGRRQPHDVDLRPAAAHVDVPGHRPDRPVRRVVRPRVGGTGDHRRAAVPATRLAEHDLGRQVQMLEVFQQLFGPYPFAGYTAVVTDDDLEIPLEAQGLSIFGANHVDGQRAASGSSRTSWRTSGSATA